MSVEYNMTAASLRGSSFRPIHAGDDYDHKFTILRDASPIDLTAAKIWLTVKESSLESDASSKLQLDSESGAIEITNAIGGEFTVKFRSTDTADLEGVFLYDLQIKLGPPASTIITVAFGKIEFLPNITRATA